VQKECALFQAEFVTGYFKETIRLARSVLMSASQYFASLTTKGVVMFRKTVIAGLTTAALAAPAAALAQAPSGKPADKPSIPTLDQVLEASGVAIDGYLDVAYTHLSGTGLFTSGTANRVFDTERNSFMLHQAAVTIAKQPKQGFGGLVNLTAGKDAQVIHSFTGPAADTSLFDVTQAFAQYASGPLTVIAGKFVTSAGAEVINSTSNVNYSRSILFGYAIPFTHTGLRATYAASDMFSVTAGVNNGWDVIKDTNSQKTGELGFSLTPTKSLTISAMDHFGTERVGGLVPAGPEGKRNLIDLVVTYAVTDKLSLTLNYDDGTQDNASTGPGNGASTKKWSGLAGYVTYQFTDTWRLAFRAETFDDKDGYRTGVVQKWKEGTFTLAYLPAKNVELRGEVREDRSDKASFAKPDGPADKKQTSVALQALYKF
jgi:hypothetical protein